MTSLAATPFTAAPWIEADGHAALAAAYPARPAALRHALHDLPLFALDALAALAERLPAADVEHSLGNLAIDQDPDAIERLAMPVGDIVRGLAGNGCWMVLKKVDQDAAYAELLDAILHEIDDIVRPRTGANMRREAFIFLSAPNSITPYHMDPEHNILFQITGTKTMRVFAADRFAIVPQVQEEAFHRGGIHRNMRFDPTFDAHAIDFAMAPGDAVHVPVKMPHWVHNGPVPSISFSVTWRSRASDDDARVNRVNHRLRALGLNPARPGDRPWGDAGKIAAHKLTKRVTAAGRALIGKPRARIAY